MIGLFYTLIGAFIHHRLNSYPVPKSNDNSSPREFREQNARHYLEKIVNYGPRIFGSEANKNARTYVLEVIQEIQAIKTVHNTIEVSVQTVNGSFTLDFFQTGCAQVTSLDMELTNIEVKFSPFQQANSSVIINCHYDSAVDSPSKILLVIAFQKILICVQLTLQIVSKNCSFLTPHKNIRKMHHRQKF